MHIDTASRGDGARATQVRDDEAGPGQALERRRGRTRCAGRWPAAEEGGCVFRHRLLPTRHASDLGTTAGATDFWLSSPNQGDGPRMIGQHPMGNLCETRDMEADYKTKKISENFRISL